jgi:hypothetical protein
MNNLATAKLNFSDHLTKALLAKYKKKVSIVFFVNQFNLRAYGTNTIAYETGRKWLKGISIPQLSKMKVLIKWLDLDPGFLFLENELETGYSTPIASDNIAIILSVQDSQHLLDCLQTVSLSLDTKSQRFLLLSALTLRELLINQPVNIDYKTLLQSLDRTGTFSKHWT